MRDDFICIEGRAGGFVVSHIFRRKFPGADGIQPGRGYRRHQAICREFCGLLEQPRRARRGHALRGGRRFFERESEPSHGRKELEDHYTTIFTTFLKNAHTTDTVRSIRFLAPDLANVDIDWLVTEPSAPGGVLRKGLLTWVVSKRNGQWMIVIYHEQSF